MMLNVTSAQSQPELQQAFANAVAGLSGFFGWASAYGQELTSVPELREAIGAGDGTNYLALSTALSASFNFGCDPESQTIYFAVEPEEFDWLPMLPIEEVVIGAEHVYVLSQAVDLGAGDVLPALAIEIETNQPLLWHAFLAVKDIGFTCVKFDRRGNFIEEVAPLRYPVRFAF